MARKPKLRPDEEIDLIREKLLRDVETIVSACRESEDWRHRLYSRINRPGLTISPPQC